MEWSKIYNPKAMNSFQFVAMTGFIMCGFAQLLLSLWGKTVESFNYLYLCWSVLYIYGAVQNLRHNPEDDHHHHHHH